MTSPKLYCVDMNGIIHWLYHADESCTQTPDNCGIAVDAWLKDLIQECQPTHLLLAFDSHKNWRKDLHLEYKANRIKRDVNIYNQIRAIKNRYGNEYPVLCVDNYEADDVIGAAAMQLHDQAEVVIVSSDKDMFQLLEYPGVKIFDPRKKEVIDEDVFVRRFNFMPHRFREYLALVGDAADNVPGVSGWGKVVATQAIVQTKSITGLVSMGLVKSFQNITDKNQQKFVDAYSDFKLSHQLVTLNTDIGDELISLDNFKLKPLEEV